MKHDQAWVYYGFVPFTGILQANIKGPWTLAIKVKKKRSVLVRFVNPP